MVGAVFHTPERNRSSMNIPAYKLKNLHSRSYNERYFFDGELGALCTVEQTVFRLWAPTASKVTLLLDAQEIPLRSGSRGSWEITVPGDWHGSRYRYRISFPYGVTHETVDPYARGANANGEWGFVVDVERLLGPAKRLPSFSCPGDAIIYEAHVRDLTICPTNGIKNKGKFLGLAEDGTRTEEGNLSGLDYIESLGITHLQLLPVYDFGSVDEAGDLSFDAQYNWGYDPVHYNCPEGSYSTDPNDPFARLTEFRALVDAAHAKGIRVIMDVVCNHVYEVETNPLERTVPGYYFRMTEEGSFHNATGCGNETASEQLMMRKFIVDSVTYWARTFGLDGFRFDLMGIHDVDTMNAVREALDEIDPGIIILGEGWSMGNHPEGVIGANQDNGYLMPGIAMFNDSFRDIIKGNNFFAGDAGFISGRAEYVDPNTRELPSHLPEIVAAAIKASQEQVAQVANERSAATMLYRNMIGAQGVRRYLHAGQSVVYNEAHDNFTMFDKLSGTEWLAQAGHEEIARRHTLATGIQFFSHGIVFLHAGQEFLRTKGGDDNSYISPDSVNAFDYDRAGSNQYGWAVDYVRGLIELRKRYPEFRLTDYEDINGAHALLHSSGFNLSFRVDNGFGPGHDAIVGINAAQYGWPVRVQEGRYRVRVNDRVVFEDPEEIELHHEFVVPPLTLSVLEHLGELTSDAAED